MAKLTGTLQEKWGDLPIEHVVLATDTFCVFLDHDLEVDWATNDDHKQTVDEKKVNEILNEAAELETTPCDEFSEKTIKHFKRLIGEAIARVFSDDYKSAKLILKSASKYIIARGQETSRLWYLSASGSIALLFALFGLSFWLFRSCLIPLVGDQLFWLSIAAVAGAVGALLSVIGRTGKQSFDCAAGFRLHLLEGSSRIVAGAISGAVVAFAVRSGLVLSALSSHGNVIPIALIAAFAAGTGERLASHLISDLGADTRKLKADKPLKAENHDE